MATPDWITPLDRLVNARTLSEAQQATAELIDYALPGGSAVVDDGADLVSAIARIRNLRVHVFRACSLWVLVLMRRWVGVWQLAANSAGAGPRTGEAAERELATARQLELVARDLAPMVLDADPEVRSMAYRLVGSALPTPEAIEIIKEPLSKENDNLARACGVEAAALALARSWPNVTSSSLDWLHDLIMAGGRDAEGRLHHLLLGRAAIGIERSAQAMLSEVTNGLNSLPPEGPFWPVELI